MLALSHVQGIIFSEKAEHRDALACRGTFDDEVVKILKFYGDKKDELLGRLDELQRDIDHLPTQVTCETASSPLSSSQSDDAACKHQLACQLSSYHHPSSPQLALVATLFPVMPTAGCSAVAYE